MGWERRLTFCTADFALGCGVFFFGFVQLLDSPSTRLLHWTPQSSSPSAQVVWPREGCDKHLLGELKNVPKGKGQQFILITLLCSPDSGRLGGTESRRNIQWVNERFVQKWDEIWDPKGLLNVLGESACSVHALGSMSKGPLLSFPAPRVNNRYWTQDLAGNTHAF